MKKIIIILCLLAMFLASCKSEEEATVPDGESVQDEQVSTVVEPDLNTEPIPQEQEQDQIEENAEQLEYYSLTTGLKCSREEQQLRPIAVMYNNNKASYPQNGISDADIVYECDAEGGLTRLMAVFSKWQEIEEIGSVRSARDYFISLAEAHGAIYIHAGGSPSAYAKLKNSDIDYVDGVNMYDLPSDVFYRSKQRISKNGYEHSMMTDGSRLLKAIDFCNYSLEHDSSFEPFMNFDYSANQNDFKKTASCVTLKHSAYITVEFQYNKETNKYYKYSFKEPHVDGINNEQLSFENVIIMFVKETVVDDEGRLNIDFSSEGSGYYFNGGEYTDITWSKDSGSSQFIFETDGETLLLNPGKTHISLFNKKYRENVLIK